VTVTQSTDTAVTLSARDCHTATVSASDFQSDSQRYSTAAPLPDTVTYSRCRFYLVSYSIISK